MLFAAGEPLEISRLAQALSMPSDEVRNCCRNISQALESDDFPLELLFLDSCVQLCTSGKYAADIRSALSVARNVPLSQAAFETLAVIAYNQPATRALIEQVRGVDSSSVVSSLCDKGLIEEAGRLDLPGRPVAYRTTPSFLRCFGLSSLDDLPSIESSAPEAEDDIAVEQLELYPSD